VAAPEFRLIRLHTRYRRDLTGERTRGKQRAEKLLESAAVKLSSVVTDILAQTGPDMSRFPTGGHLASWCGRTPLDKQSGKRTGRSRHKNGNKYVAAATGETAISAGKTDTREGARYRKLARSRGKAKACVALGNTQLKVYHKLLSNPGMRYEDLGSDYYDQRRSHHAASLERPGYKVTIERIDPETGEMTGDIPAS